MARLGIARIFFRELTAPAAAPRILEPELLMDDPAQVKAYAQAGAEGGSLTPVYVFNSSQVSEVIRPGDTVVDLACGPANQLVQIARLNRQTRFIAVDLASRMLEEAKAAAARFDLGNVEFRQADVTDLRFLPAGSVDAVISTLALHHLPDRATLRRAMGEVARILKAGGGIYFADLGHLRSEQSIDEFAAQYADVQPGVFTADYRNSMRAAFSLRDLRDAARVIGPRIKVFSTFLVPYMVAIKSAPRREFDPQVRNAFRQLIKSLPEHQQADLRNLRRFFRLGGLRSRYLT